MHRRVTRRDDAFNPTCRFLKLVFVSGKESEDNAANIDQNAPIKFDL
jgi:hypothetical protein